MQAIELEKILSEIHKQNVEAGKLSAETRKYVEEAGKLTAERNKMDAERYKIERERQWYPVMVGAAVATAASAFGAAMIKFFA